MKGNKALNIVTLVGVLLTLVALSGCGAPADGQQSSAGIYGFLPLIIIMALLFGMFYLFMIRPFRQREKQHDHLINELVKGDMVITAGGIFGQVERVDEDSIVLRVESGAAIRVTKGAVLARPGTREKAG